MLNAAKFLSGLYGDDEKILAVQTARYNALAQEFHSRFPNCTPHFFSTPGRTELGGNHTDHNHGKVLAASINLDAIAAAAPAVEQRITIYSTEYPTPFIVELSDLGLRTLEHRTTAALLRGMVAGFQQRGYQFGGVNACLTSDVKVGSGLSSSAAIEVLFGTILNAFYNENSISPLRLAQIGQYAENVYFNKPCGLMDQIACATGGGVAIDFENPEQPRVEKIEFDFAQNNYRLLVVDTGGHHADLTDDYAAVPREMKAVAAQLGKNFCREISRDEILKNIHELRSHAGDRAVLRALHFLEENARVDRQVAALRSGDFSAFLREVNASGQSSMRWLQNCFSPQNVAEQGITLALAFTENYLTKIGAGACRVHGGGFAGTIQVFLPNPFVAGYIDLMEGIFKRGAVQVLNIRRSASLRVTA